MLSVRPYHPADWEAIQAVHDAARKIELSHAKLSDAFLPLEIAAEREELFDYPGLFVAEEDGRVTGFAACDDEELAWLYVAPEHQRRGIGRALVRHALEQFPDIRTVEVLMDNHPARQLYEAMGFSVAGTASGAMPGNEAFRATVWRMER